MRILLWHGYLLGGTGSNVYTRALAREWSLAGHDVTVLCQEPHPERYDLADAGVKIIFNYTEALLDVPSDVAVHTSNPAVELLYALYFHLT